MSADWPTRRREAWEAAVRQLGGPPFGLRHWDGDRRMHGFGSDGGGAYLGPVSSDDNGSTFTVMPPLDEWLREQARSLLRPDDQAARAAAASAPIEQVTFDVDGTPTAFSSVSAGGAWVSCDPIPYAWSAYVEVAALAVTISARLAPRSTVALVRANAADYL